MSPTFQCVPTLFNRHPTNSRVVCKTICEAENDERYSLKQTAEEMRPPKKVEWQQLGMYVEDIAPVAILKTKKNALCDGDHLPALKIFHELRLQYNRSLRSLPVELEVQPLPPGLPHRVDASRFCAVLIGINEYISHPLRGCVSDVRLMEMYLTEILTVPRDRIQLLLGSKEHMSPDDPMNPSRAHIIGALSSIITNPEIAHGDNIIIYFSGHGSYYPCSEYDEDDETGSIEALCPIDRDTLDANGIPVPDISDREFNGFLAEISRAKGRRITVILDCCHSGGASRSLPEPGVRTVPRNRRATINDMLLAGEYKLNRYPSYRSILSRDWYPDTDCHVVLAACREYQFAHEKPVQREDGRVEYIGIFTDSLVRALRSGYWKEETTYADLVHGLDNSMHQTPVVAGTHKHARLWYQE